MAVELYGALQGFKSILDNLKAIIGIRDEVLRNEALAKLLREIMELERKLRASEEEKAALVEKVRTLETEIAQLKAQRGDLDRYELQDIGGGAAAYMLKPDARGAEPAHWLCPSCYSQGKKAMYQRSVRFSQGTVYRCAQCSGHVTTREVPAWR